MVLAAEAYAFDPGTGWLTQTWQIEEGLPDTIVSAVAQGPDGYLWVGTAAGLVRFDGVRFEKIPLQGLPGIPNEGVRALRVDRQGAIWVGMDRGQMVCLESGGERVVTEGQGLPSTAPSVIADDPAGGVWVGYTSRGMFVRIQNGEVARFNSREGLSQRGPWWLGNDVKGELWLTYGQRLGRFTDGKFRVCVELKDPIARFAEARSGGLWICAGRHLLRWTEGREPEERGALPAGISAGAVRALLEDHAGAVWVGTSTGGLFRWDGGEWVHVPTSHSEITCLTEDREGDVWAGTAGGGLNRLRPHVLEMLGTKAGLPFESIRSATEDASGAVWITTASGRLFQQQTNGGIVELAGTNWPGGHATCVAADRRGAVWVGTEEAGLYRLQQGGVRHWGRREGLASNSIRSLLVGSDGDVWIATSYPNRLHRLHGETILALKTPTQVQALRAMAQDAEGTVWLGSSWGELLRVQGDEVVEDAATEAARRTPIRCLLATPDGSLWIGYAGRGLGHVKGGRYSQITPAQGLGEDHISQMLEDGRGRMWFAGIRGFFRVNRADLLDLVEGRAERVRSIRYAASEEVSSPQAASDFHPGAVLGRDGSLWFATRKGVALIHTENLRENSDPPPVLMERMTVDGRTVAMRDPRWWLKPAGDGVVDLRAPGIALRLSPGHRKVEFEFTAPSFPATENVRFRYRLEGFDDNWTEVGLPRAAVYARLPAGEFRFHVLACNNDDVWNEAGATLAFTVAPFFWQTWWFRIGALSGFAGLVGVTVRYWSHRRLRRELERLEQKAALERERARIARDLHDDLGASLTQVGLMLEELLEQPTSPSEMKAQSGQISSRVRSLARDLDAVVWAVNPRNDSLANLAAYLSQFFLESFRTTAIRPRLDVAEEFPDQPISPEARQHLFLAAKEAINNVIKHAQAAEVRLTMSVVGGEFELKLEDDGHGFSTMVAETSSRQGLKNLRTRLNELGGRCAITSQPSSGTCVRLTVPLYDNPKLRLGVAKED
ncbi:MAG: two-component regulator propeller domain-containing protein [Verrucomicrobiae bacterium]